MSLESLVDLICLVYHEARNVRHPIKNGLLSDPTKYAALVNLPTNRDQAWASMAKLRQKALGPGSARGAAQVFEKQFGLSLGDLLDLYNAPFWKGSAYGGNKWAPVYAKVQELVEAIESGDKERSTQLLEMIPRLEHNTGVVGNKLANLGKIS